MKQTGGKQNGFTLVEVIVVAVIVLILSAVAIPMYNGFVRQARVDAMVNLAETAAAAANSYWRKTGTEVTDNYLKANTGELKLYYDSTKYTVKQNGDNIEVKSVDKTPDTTISREYMPKN